MTIERRPAIEAVGTIAAGSDITVVVDLGSGEDGCQHYSPGIEVEVHVVCTMLDFGDGGNSATRHVRLTPEGGERVEIPARISGRAGAPFEIVAAFTHAGRHSGIARLRLEPEPATTPIP